VYQLGCVEFTYTSVSIGYIVLFSSATTRGSPSAVKRAGVASRIINANHGIMRTAAVHRVTDCIDDRVGLVIKHATIAQIFYLIRSHTAALTSRAPFWQKILNLWLR
jgi:hypothetical protein